MLVVDMSHKACYSLILSHVGAYNKIRFLWFSRIKQLALSVRAFIEFMDLAPGLKYEP